MTLIQLNNRKPARSLQFSLKKLGYYHGPLDGQWNKVLLRAVSSYQYDKRLPVTGNVTKRLIRSLKKEMLN